LYYFGAQAGGRSITLEIVWNGKHKETLVIEYVDTTEPEPEVKGSIARDPGNTGGKDLTVTVDGETITFDGNIEWYPVDESVGRNEAGNRVGVEITAPEGFDASGAVVTIGDDTYENLFTAEKNYFWWYPLVTQAGQQFTATVVWNESSTQVFTVKIADTAKLEKAPVEEVTRTAAPTQDPGNTGGDLEYNFADGTLTISGTIADIPESTNPAGVTAKWIGVNIPKPTTDVADAGTIHLTIKEAGKEPVVHESVSYGEGDPFLYYFGAQAGGRSITLEIVWNGKHKETLVIEYVDTTEPEPEVKGSIARDPGNTGGKDLTVTVDGETITFDGNIEWYPVDESVGRNEAGNRVGVEITAPEGFDASGAVVTIGDDTYENLFTAEKNYFWWYPLVTEAGETFTATVEWNSASTQVFTVKIADTATLEKAPVADEALAAVNNYLTPERYVYADAPEALEEHLAVLGLDVGEDSDYAALDKTATGGKNRKAAVFYDLNNNKPAEGYDLATLTDYFNDMVATRLVTEESMDLVNNAENTEALNGISFVTMLLDRFRAVSYATHSDIPVETKIATLQGLVDRYNGLESDEDRELVLQKLLEKRPTDGYARSQATTDALAEALTEVEEEQAVLLERVNASQLRITEANQAEYTIGELLVEEFGLTATGDRLTEIISIFWFDNYHYQNKFTFASIGAVKTALNAAVAEHDKIVATFQGTGGYPTNAEAVESFLSSALRLAKTSAGYNPDTWLAQEIEELAKFSDSVTAGETGATIDEPLKTAVNNIENDTTIDTLAEFFAAFQAALAQ
jgi:nicotinamide mononucleotide adenylyltransferase